MQIGDKIAEARKRKNLTQEQLAQRMSVTRQTVSRWESQTAYPEMEKIVQLAAILEVSCDYLLNDRMKQSDIRESGGKAAPPAAVTRLLEETKGRCVRLYLAEEGMDFEINDVKVVMMDFDGSWASVLYKKGKKKETKLIPISSINAIKLEKEDPSWKC